MLKYTLKGVRRTFPKHNYVPTVSDFLVHCVCGNILLLLPLSNPDCTSHRHGNFGNKSSFKTITWVLLLHTLKHARCPSRMSQLLWDTFRRLHIFWHTSNFRIHLHQPHRDNYHKWSQRFSSGGEMTVRTAASVPPDCLNPAPTFTVPLLDSRGKVVPSIRRCTQRQRPLFVQLWPLVLPVGNGIRYIYKSKNNTSHHHAPLEPDVSYGPLCPPPSPQDLPVTPTHTFLTFQTASQTNHPCSTQNVFHQAPLPLWILCARPSQRFLGLFIAIQQIICSSQQSNI